MGQRIGGKAVLLWVLALLAGGVPAAAETATANTQCTVEHVTSSAADTAYNNHDYTGAERLYRADLEASPRSVPAMSGLVRSQVALVRLSEALESINRFNALVPNNPQLLDVLGEVLYRRGEVAPAAATFAKALQLDPCNARVHLDLGRYFNLVAMFATGWQHLELAHKLSPDDPLIRDAWLRTQPHATPEQQLAALNERLLATNLTAEEREGILNTIAAIKARQKGDCHVATPITAATLKMVPISRGPMDMYGAGLEILLNAKKRRFQIDTGASGLLISRSAVASAGLVPEAEIKTGGLGDKGSVSSYMTHVDSIRIGELEFRNCMVRVLEKGSALDVDGLIGTDVFRSYVVTLDTPGREIRLTPLPRRPDEAAPAVASLDTAGESGTSAASPAEGRRQVYYDRYIAPEMKDWTPIYRVGHQLIFPTRIADTPPKLFIMDTGASRGLISPAAAREVTHVSSDEVHKIRGLSGEVNNVFSADSVTIYFAKVAQKMRDVTSIDTTAVSRWTGLEISGFIGFPTLRELVISIDYRDNLVHVVYDPQHGFHAR